MINKDLVINNVESYINSEMLDFDLHVFDDVNPNNPVEKFLRNCTVRLIHEYDKYLRGQAGKSDFLSSLRDFMLSYSVDDLRIEDSELVKDNDFGIQLAGTSFHYFCAPDFPKYILHKEFINAAIINQATQVSVIKSKYQLQTNRYIYDLTHYESFHSFEQKVCVYGALNTPAGFTSLICMPTGGGKSLISQSVAYENEGLTIVIVPTVSLAIDQARAGKTTIKRENTATEIFAYYGGVENPDQIFKAIDSRTARLLFISPEALLLNDVFKEKVSNAATSGYLKNIVIDEAHIVIAWGDFFRVDYQCLEPWRNRLVSINPKIRTFLLSATFDDRTTRLLRNMFGSENKWLEIRCDSLRKEPRFEYIPAYGYYDKQKKVLELVNKLPHPMILYVNSPYEAEELKSYLNNNGYLNIRTFTGDTSNELRESLIKSWIKNEYKVMIATSAFGIGVDKPDVRTVVHMYVPDGPDAYYQELGRGGRDGLPCLSIMCIDPKSDIQKAYNHISKVLTAENFIGRWNTMWRNPRNSVQNGSISIDTSIKPNPEKLGYYEEGNKKHEQWNINALLLLRRYQRISIKDVEYQGEHYIFTVDINDDSIVNPGPVQTKVLSEIRDSEANDSLKRFNEIKKSILRADKLCWSDMFTSTYMLVSGYCAGCNQHPNPQADVIDEFPLHSKLNGPEKPLSEFAKSYFGDTSEAIYINSGNKTQNEILHVLKPFKYNLVVSNNRSDFKEMSEQPSFIVMNYREFRDLLIKDNKFFVSGLVIAIYDNDEALRAKEFRSIKKYVKEGGYVIHVIDINDVIPEYGKTMSDLIDGVVIDENAIKGGLN